MSELVKKFIKEFVNKVIIDDFFINILVSIGVVFYLFDVKIVDDFIWNLDIVMMYVK